MKHVIASVHVLALATWFAALASIMVAAPAVFGELKALSPRVDQYPLAAVSEHGRLAAGHVMDGVFRTTMVIQLIAGPLAVFSGIAIHRSARRSANWPVCYFHLWCLIIAGILFAAFAMFVYPPMNDLLGEIRERASRPFVTPEERTLMFPFLHAIANILLTAVALLVVIAMATLPNVLHHALRDNSALRATDAP